MKLKKNSSLQLFLNSIEEIDRKISLKLNNDDMFNHCLVEELVSERGKIIKILLTLAKKEKNSPNIDDLQHVKKIMANSLELEKKLTDRKNNYQAELMCLKKTIKLNRAYYLSTINETGQTKP